MMYEVCLNIYKKILLIVCILTCGLLSAPYLAQIHAQQAIVSEHNDSIELPVRYSSSILGEWNLIRFNEQEKELFYRLLSSGKAETYPILYDLSTHLSVQLIAPTSASTTPCGHVDSSCVVTKYKTNGWPSEVTLYLQRDHLEATHSGRFMLWHELGHVIEVFGFDDATMEEFKTKSNYDSYVKSHTGEKINIYESWAEHFAMWITEDKSHSTYQVKKNLSDKTIVELLSQYKRQN